MIAAIAGRVRAAAGRSGAQVAAAALCGAALALLTAAAPPLTALETRARDTLHALAYPPVDPSPDIALVVFTEADLARMTYRSPLDRAMIADVVEALIAKGAAAVGLDILFDQPTEPAKDERLRALLSRQDGPPVIAAAADEADGLTPAQAAWQAAFLAEARIAHPGLLLDPLVGAARMVEGPRVVHDRPTPPLSYALAQAAGAPTPDGPVAIVHLRRADDFAAPTAPRYPAVTAPMLPPAWIEGRIVLIGADLPGVDRLFTPLSALRGQTEAGVFAHAAALRQLLEDRRLRETPPAADVALTALAAALAALAIVAPLPGRAGRIGALTLGAALVALAPAAALAGGGLRAPTATPLAAYLMAAGGLAFARWRSEAAARAFLREAFGRYVSAAVAEQLTAAPEMLRLGGERREISCVFTDVAGFTALCEALEPEALCALLNAYLDGASTLFVDHGATIDKFVGDAVIGFVGAPAARDDHAAAAVRLALALDAFARDFDAQVRARGETFGAVRIGVHTGEATVGNFGGDRFFDYTAMGDTVNTAARLEGANKAFGTTVCVSDATWRAARAHDPDLRGRPICAAVLSGKAQAIEVWEPLADGAPPGRAPLEAYGAAFAALRDGRPGAAAAFAALSRDWPEDSLVRFHTDRLTAGAQDALVRFTSK